MPLALRLVVFDLDGTLIDSSKDLCCAVNAALLHVGRGALPEAVIAGYIGDGAAALVHRALGEADGEETFDRTYQFFLHYYREHKLDHTLPYPGVMEALAEIRRHRPDLLMAVLTNKPVNPSRDICEALGMSRYFFQNYGGNSFATKKPEPEGLLQLIAEASALLGCESIEGEQVVMVGDSGVDVKTARRAGVRSVGCSFGLAPEALAVAEPDITVEHPGQWVAALRM